MDKEFRKDIIFPMGAIIFLVLVLLYFLTPKYFLGQGLTVELNRNHWKQIDYANFSIYLVIVSGVLLTIAFVLRAGKKFKESELKDYKPEDFEIVEEETYTLAELNYVIKKIEKIIEENDQNTWQWEIKLKSVIYRRNKLINGVDHASEVLSSEQIDKLKNESHLLKLNNYTLKARSDISTVHSIKEKMSLYKQHNQERV